MMVEYGFSYAISELWYHSVTISFRVRTMISIIKQQIYKHRSSFISKGIVRFIFNNCFILARVMVDLLLLLGVRW